MGCDKTSTSTSIHLHLSKCDKAYLSVTHPLFLESDLHQTSGWINDWDRVLRRRCPSGQAVSQKVGNTNIFNFFSTSSFVGHWSLHSWMVQSFVPSTVIDSVFISIIYFRKYVFFFFLWCYKRGYQRGSRKLCYFCVFYERRQKHKLCPSALWFKHNAWYLTDPWMTSLRHAGLFHTIYGSSRDNRPWKISCKAFETSRTCCWPAHVNHFSETMEFKCSDNQVVAGADSYHSNS